MASPHSPSALLRKGLQTVKWTVPVSHVVITSLHSQLTASLSKGQGLRATPRFAVQVWVEGGSDDKILAHAFGSVCPKNSRSAVHVHWLGREKECPGYEGDGWRFVDAERTVAQALLGVLAAIAENCGMSMVELDAEDTGSGKLIQYYKDLGFSIKPGHKREKCTIGAELRMQAPIRSITLLAPEDWSSRLIPSDFSVWSWFWGRDHSLELRTVFDSLGLPDKWSWEVDWPTGAVLNVQMRIDSGSLKLFFDVSLNGAGLHKELAVAKGAVRLAQQAMRVIWLGSSGSKPVDASIRGRLLDGSRCGDQRGGTTVAVSLLGVLAALARWLSARSMELTALDDGSGKLLTYLRSLGFEEPPSSGPEPCMAGPCQMTADCEGFARRICPEDWREKLPPDSQLSVLMKMVHQFKER